MAHFSGTIAYEHALNWPPNGAPPAASPVILDLGRVEEIAQVFVNDRAAGVQMWAPYRFDIAPYLTPGRNRIRVAVTNTLANAIDKQSLPSGLLGPVKIWYS
jgi:hypothetical protein